LAWSRDQAAPHYAAFFGLLLRPSS